MGKFWSEKAKKRWGKKFFGFDEEFEKGIYFYLQKEKVWRKMFKRLKQQGMLFDFKYQWKAYIERKYQKCSKDYLEEFIEYLKQRRRKTHAYNVFSEQNATPFISSIVAAVAVDPLVDMLAETSEIMEQGLLSALVVVGLWCLISFVLAVVIVPIMNGIIEGITNRRIQKDFFDSYIEIIEDIGRTRPESKSIEDEVMEAVEKMHNQNKRGYKMKIKKEYITKTSHTDTVC